MMCPARLERATYGSGGRSGDSAPTQPALESYGIASNTNTTQAKALRDSPCPPENRASGQNKIGLQSDVQESVEESAVALQGDTQIFGGNVVSPAPLAFQFRPFSGEAIRQMLDHFCNQRVCLLDRSARLINEASLNLRPPRSEAACFLFGE